MWTKRCSLIFFRTNRSLRFQCRCSAERPPNKLLQGRNTQLEFFGVVVTAAMVVFVCKHDAGVDDDDDGGGDKICPLLHTRWKKKKKIQKYFILEFLFLNFLCYRLIVKERRGWQKKKKTVNCLWSNQVSCTSAINNESRIPIISVTTMRMALYIPYTWDVLSVL